MRQFLEYSPTWLWSIVIMLAAVFLGLVVHRVVFALARKVAGRTKSPFDAALVRHSERPLKFLAPVLVALAALPLLPISVGIHDIVSHILVLGLIAAIGWMTTEFIDVFDDVLSVKHAVDSESDLRARHMQTQVHVLRRIANAVIMVITAGIMLMTFPSVRQLGTGLFASAGIAGIVAGFAARPTLSNLLAGVQIALTEPIRLHDVVIVEGEWGRIEQIGITYVVVRIWDNRRFVLPLSYFIEKPFQNWTLVSADLLCTVLFYVDYAVPVETVRAELRRLLATTDLWDGKEWSLQVTNTTDRAVELRAMMSAADAAKAWDLRCLVREKLIAFLQVMYPQSLPCARVTVSESPL